MSKRLNHMHRLTRNVSSWLKTLILKIIVLLSIHDRGVIVESFPSYPVARIRFPAGSGILISVLGLGACPLHVSCSVLFFGGAPDILLTTNSERRALVLFSNLGLWLPLLGVWCTSICIVGPWECKSYVNVGNDRKKEEKKQEDPLRSYSLSSAIVCLFVLIIVLKFVGNE